MFLQVAMSSVLRPVSNGEAIYVGIWLCSYKQQCPAMGDCLRARTWCGGVWQLQCQQDNFLCPGCKDRDSTAMVCRAFLVKQLC